MTEINGELLKAALLGNQVGEAITRDRLKKLINDNRWATIGHMFDFEPRFMVVGGNRVFDWNSCSDEFWKVYNVVPEPASPGPLVYTRSAWMFQEKKRTDRVNKQRHTLYRRQEGKCYYCFQFCEPKAFTIDHVVPKANGGSNSIKNKVGACSSCNQAKGRMSQEEFLKSNYLENKFKWIEACKRNAELLAQSTP